MAGQNVPRLRRRYHQHSIAVSPASVAAVTALVAGAALSAQALQVALIGLAQMLW